MSAIAYLDCHSGISGDMFLGALLDAGLSFEALKQALTALPISDYQLTFEPCTDKGIRGSHFDVLLTGQEQPTRHLSDIVTILHAANLPLRARDIALAVFRCLAEAEATVHGTSVEEVHFHEVGAVDAIVDITGAALGIDMLNITQFYASPLPLTSGRVKTAHGLLPVPAPATMEILRKVQAPWRPVPVEGELVTPTGAALLATLAQFEVPALNIEQIGYGFGRKQLPWPNCLRLCLGTASPLVRRVDNVDEELESDWVAVIETNIDNMSGELLGGLMERLLAIGALDVSYTALQMKKNRPATLVSIICRPEDVKLLAQVLLQETSTLGVRIQHMQRLKAHREQHLLATPLGTMLIKLKRLGTRIISASPEYEECQRIARERNLPLTEVYDVALHTIQTSIIGKNNIQ